MCNTPQAGDEVLYWTKFDTMARGLLAERGISPLTGNPRYRVVDSASEMRDDEAGKWIDVMAVVRMDAPEGGAA